MKREENIFMKIPSGGAIKKLLQATKKDRLRKKSIFFVLKQTIVYFFVGFSANAVSFDSKSEMQKNTPADIIMPIVLRRRRTMVFALPVSTEMMDSISNLHKNHAKAFLERY